MCSFAIIFKGSHEDNANTALVKITRAIAMWFKSEIAYLYWHGNYDYHCFVSYYAIYGDITRATLFITIGAISICYRCDIAMFWHVNRDDLLLISELDFSTPDNVWLLPTCCC